MKTTVTDGESAASMTRRSMLQLGGIGAIGGAMAIEAGALMLSPIEAHAQDLPLKIFTKSQADLLGTLGDVLLPGARESGMVEFVDHQLSKSVPLLIVRYFNWPGDLTAFYKQGLAALDAASAGTYGLPFVRSMPRQQAALVGSMLGGKLKGWDDGPPSRLFYLATRSDAVDVVYGTVDGFKKLNVPYMPHIVPAEQW